MLLPILNFHHISIKYCLYTLYIFQKKFSTLYIDTIKQFIILILNYPQQGELLHLRLNSRIIIKGSVFIAESYAFDEKVNHFQKCNN